MLGNVASELCSLLDVAGTGANRDSEPLSGVSQPPRVSTVTYILVNA